MKTRGKVVAWSSHTPDWKFWQSYINYQDSQQKKYSQGSYEEPYGVLDDF